MCNNNNDNNADVQVVTENLPIVFQIFQRTIQISIAWYLFFFSLILYLFICLFILFRRFDVSFIDKKYAFVCLFIPFPKNHLMN